MSYVQAVIPLSEVPDPLQFLDQTAVSQGVDCERRPSVCYVPFDIQKDLFLPMEAQSSETEIPPRCNTFKGDKSTDKPPLKQKASSSIRKKRQHNKHSVLSDEQKIVRRRERNREHARACRLRKQRIVDDLKDHVEDLKRKLQGLQKAVEYHAPTPMANDILNKALQNYQNDANHTTISDHGESGTESNSLAGSESSKSNHTGPGGL